MLGNGPPSLDREAAGLTEFFFVEAVPGGLLEGVTVF